MASKARTEKGAISNATTGSARLNLFFKAVRSLGKDVPQLHELLAASWSEDALDTLKIVFQSRDCRGGKGEKKLFAESLLWLSKQHPSTLGKNIKHIPEFGMWKDLLALVPTPFVDDVLKMFAKQLRDDLNKVQAYEKKQKEKKEKKEAEAQEKKEAEAQEKKEAETQEAQEEKKEGDGADAVVTKDTKNKKERPPLPHISLAAKWAPTEKHGDDKKTGSALKLALLLSEDPKTALRDYRKNYLTPLRAHLKIIETFACAKRWDEIPYTLVPSRCMNLHKKEFEKYDKARFAAYLEDVKAGKSTIKGKQMMPHELVEQYFNKGGPVDEVIELQWKVLADETRKLGSLAQSLVLSDVSGSMSGTPMMVSIALGLLISEVTAAPFTNSVITFHEKPSYHVVKGSTLQERVKSLAGAQWGGTTNFQGVFDLILDKAVANKVPAKHMPKKLFVISDMQFDSADRNYATNFETIKSRYAKSGYAMPQLIFWNVRSSPNDFPVMKDEIGVAMVSGFSPSLLKSILTASDLATPWELLREILDAPRYKVLQV